MREGEFVTNDQLAKEWTNTLSTYDLFIEQGHKLRPIRFIVRHIIDKGYHKFLFPGTSMFSLLISLPKDNKVNYNKTLKIDFDQMTEVLSFRFSDWTGIDRQKSDSRKQIRWEETCQATEGIALLENFLTENENFNLTTESSTP